MYVTYSDLFQFVIMLATVVSVVYVIVHKNRPKK